MLVRIVKMTFEKDKVESFLAIFESNRLKIREFEGCKFLELLQDKHEENIFFTHSYWKSETDLENYRNSELFKDVWKKTKALFCEAPKAWSLSQIKFE